MQYLAFQSMYYTILIFLNHERIALRVVSLGRLQCRRSTLHIAWHTWTPTPENPMLKITVLRGVHYLLVLDPEQSLILYRWLVENK